VRWASASERERELFVTDDATHQDDIDQPHGRIEREREREELSPLFCAALSICTRACACVACAENSMILAQEKIRH
jgi:hypothetical protein